MLIEITPSGLLRKFALLASFLEACTPSFPGICELLLRASFPRVRTVPRRRLQFQNAIMFEYSHRIYGIVSDARSLSQYQLVIRDKFGMSRLRVQELLTNKDEMPLLGETPITVVTDASVQQVGVDIADDDLLPLSPLPQTQSEFASSEAVLEPFRPAKQRCRPIVFDVLRNLGFVQDHEHVHLLTKDHELKTQIQNLDLIAALCVIQVAVLRVSPTGVDNDVPDDVMESYFLRFATQSRQRLSFSCSTNFVQLDFIPAKECGHASYALILNPTGLAIQKDVIGAIAEQTVVSLVPLGGTLFRLVVEKRHDKWPLAFGETVLVSETYLHGFMCYLAIDQLMASEDPDLLVSGITKRAARIEELLAKCAKVAVTDEIALS